MASISQVPVHRSAEQMRRSDLGMTAAVAGLILGGGLATLVLANTDLKPFTLRLALALEYCTPGLLSLLAFRRRPGLFLAAGLIGVLVPFTAMSGVAFPLVVPATLSFVAYGRTAGRPLTRGADALIGALAVLLVLASWYSLVIDVDPYCRTSPNFSECGSDRVTGIEGGLSLAFAIAALVIPPMLARRRDA